MNRLLLCPSPWAALTSCSCADGPVLAPLGVRWAGLRPGRTYYIACYPSETLRITAIIYSCVGVERVDQYDGTNRLLFFSPAWLFDQSWCFRIQSVSAVPLREQRLRAPARKPFHFVTYLTCSLMEHGKLLESEVWDQGDCELFESHFMVHATLIN